MRATLVASTAALALAGALLARPSRADGMIIKQPGDHPSYRYELEPHLDLGFWRWGWHPGVGRDHFGDPELGAGFRATIKIVDPGFVPKINDSVGITFGADLTGCPGGGCAERFHVWLPVGLQWNFYLTKEWNVFADFGFSLRIAGDSGAYNGVHPDFFFMGGARYQFTDKVAMTFRIGYPFLSAGVSFFGG
ncbi:MAG: hypothetical protein U0359_23410 [Byssovorax sp.]